ncbi:MAG: hypothetical protein QXE79_03625 [Candidatus Bathyarchaeia archaeon]
MSCIVYPWKWMDVPSRCLRPLRFLILLLFIEAAFLSIFNPIIGEASAQVSRETPLDIQIIFIGFEEEDVDLEYLNWNNPSYKYQSVLIPGVGTGVMFRFNYAYRFASENFQDSFIDFLTSIGVEEYMRDQLWNYSFKFTHFGVSLNYTTFEADAVNTFYDADAVEEWLINNVEEVGVDTERYTLVIADLYGKIPSTTPDQFDSAISGEEALLTPHFYNITKIDRDLGYRSIGRWMTAWGGDSRLFFIDLSAGPSPSTGELPIQLAVHANRLDEASPYFKAWLTQYLSDYIYGVVYNLFAPDLLYPLNFADSYRIDILMLDNRSSPDPRLEESLNIDLIKESLEELLPFAEVMVEVRFGALSDYPELEKVVCISTSQSRGVQADFPPDKVYPPNFVDARPLYEWLSEDGEGHLKDLFEARRDERVYDIPVLVFALQRDFNLAFTFKDWISRDIWGAALYDVALISHSEYDLKAGEYPLTGIVSQPGKGYGFTQTVIHEVGHMLGLNHPFLYDQVEDFTDSVMAYYPDRYHFSQFEVDALLRAFADKLLIYVESLIANYRLNPLATRIVGDAEEKIREAERFYNDMNYLEALKSAVEARIQASRLLYTSIKGLTIEWYGIVVIAVGLISFAAGYLIHRRAVQRRPLCPYCHSSLTWIDEYKRYYCYDCERYV